MDLSVNDSDNNYLKKSFAIQLQLVRSKINHLYLVEESINDASKMLEEEPNVDWSKIINIIHVINMEKSIVEQYRNSSNLDVRIQLHKKYSTNKIGWFQWIFNILNLKPKLKVLELGCGNGELWRANQERIPEHCEIIASDISVGMISDMKDNLKSVKDSITYNIFDCHEIPYEDESIDVVIANHMVFYLKDREKVFNEINRVLKNGGFFFCSTYGKEHMKEIEELTKGFDARIALSEVNLYEIFGLENGESELKNWFSDVEKFIYNDYLMVDDYKPLLDYILSCHGNEHEYLNDRYDEFTEYLSSKMGKKGKIKITKMAGIFKCKK